LFPRTCAEQRLFAQGDRAGIGQTYSRLFHPTPHSQGEKSRGDRDGPRSYFRPPCSPPSLSSPAICPTRRRRRARSIPTSGRTPSARPFASKAGPGRCGRRSPPRALKLRQIDPDDDPRDFE